MTNLIKVLDASGKNRVLDIDVYPIIEAFSSGIVQVKFPDGVEYFNVFQQTAYNPDPQDKDTFNVYCMNRVLKRIKLYTSPLEYEKEFSVPLFHYESQLLNNNISMIIEKYENTINVRVNNYSINPFYAKFNITSLKCN